MGRPLVILNPGHYMPNDPGAVGNGLREAEVNVAIANRIAGMALKYGFNAVIVREKTLYDICRVANSFRGAALFYSIHSNAGGGTGYECYTIAGYAPPDRLRRASRVDVVAYLARYGFRDRGAKYANFFVLRNTTAPAILVENLFVDTWTDAQRLKDSQFLDGLALAHTTGIAKALGVWKEEMTVEKRYQTLAEVPEWGRATIQMLIEGKVLAGDGQGLNLSDDMVRIFVVNHRAGAYINMPSMQIDGKR